MRGVIARSVCPAVEHLADGRTTIRIESPTSEIIVPSAGPGMNQDRPFVTRPAWCVPAR
jgi:hypothetical protein